MALEETASPYLQEDVEGTLEVEEYNVLDVKDLKGISEEEARVIINELARLFENVSWVPSGNGFEIIIDGKNKVRVMLKIVSEKDAVVKVTFQSKDKVINSCLTDVWRKIEIRVQAFYNVRKALDEIPFDFDL